MALSAVPKIRGNPGARGSATPELRAQIVKNVSGASGALSAEENKFVERRGSDNFFNLLDKAFQASLARLTLGISPASVAEIYFLMGGEFRHGSGKGHESRPLSGSSCARLF